MIEAAYDLANTSLPGVQESVRCMVSHAALEKASQDEAIIREMLERWVSGCEPAVAYSEDFKILGLTLADLPVGETLLIVVAPKA